MDYNQNFKEVNIVEYIIKGLIDESLVPNLVVKTKQVKVIARHGQLDEKVKTVTSNRFLEVKSKVETNDKGILDWVVINILGQKYIADDDSFEKRYAKSDEGKNIYIPKYYPVVVLQVNENISFYNKKGEKMDLKEKGFITVDINSSTLDIACIQYDEFFSTYHLILNDTENIKPENLIKKLSSYH